MTDSLEYPVYSNAPVALVVLAVEFPPTTPSPQTLENFRSALRESFPLVEQEQHLVVQAGPAAVQQQVQQVPRFLSRDRTTAVALTPGSVVIETTRYEGLASYLDVLRGPIEAVAAVLEPDAILAIGHRYIDEIRVPGAREPDWSRWLDTELLAAANLPLAAGLEAPIRWQAMANFQTDPESTLTLRYGPMSGTGIPADGSTRRARPGPAGPYFLLDWDSRWQPTTAPEFTADLVLDRCDALYQPVRSLFRHITSDPLHKVFATIPEDAS